MDFGRLQFVDDAQIHRRGEEPAFGEQLRHGVSAEKLRMPLDKGPGEHEEHLFVVGGIEPDLGCGLGGVQIHQVQIVLLAAHPSRQIGKLVVVEIDDGWIGGELRREPKQAGQVHRLAGKQEVQPPYPMPVELLGEPVGGRAQPPLDAPGRQL